MNGIHFYRYNQLITDLVAVSYDRGLLDQKWKDLLEGVDYINSQNEDVRFDGLLKGATNYVAFYFLLGSNMTNDENGLKITTFEEASKKRPLTGHYVETYYNPAYINSLDVYSFLLAKADVYINNRTEQGAYIDSRSIEQISFYNY